MIVLVGASASGKTELSKILYHSFGYKKCITTTTREPRINELNDIDYHFLSLDEFKTKELNHEFVEVSLYNKNMYGIQKKDVGINGLVIVDPNGANALIKQFKNKVFVIYVHASKQLRKDRMLKRLDDLDLIEKRLINDEKIFFDGCLIKVDLIIENEDEHLEKIADTINLAYIKHMNFGG